MQLRQTRDFPYVQNLSPLHEKFRAVALRHMGRLGVPRIMDVLKPHTCVSAVPPGEIELRLNWLRFMAGEHVA